MQHLFLSIHSICYYSNELKLPMDTVAQLFCPSLVSTTEQSLNLQIDTLKTAGCERIFEDKVSGKKNDRVELTRYLEYLRTGDTLVIWKLDRLGRTTRQLIRVVWEARQRAEEKISKLPISNLTLEQIEKMERLSPMPESSKTFLAWLREIPGSCSPDAFLKVIEKLEYVRDIRLQIDTKGIHPNRLRQLSKVGARYEPHSFRRFDDSKKYAILVPYLIELIQDLSTSSTCHTVSVVSSL